VRSAEIRRRFLAHFERNGHLVVPSASLIAPDPTLLLVNAGMVPFKPYFLGQLPPPGPRATSVQKCVRTPDIEEVGKTSRHGTFFQMAGNFSFGDYFKEGAIRLAWELSTNSVDDGGFGLDADRIWVTVYHDDDEAAAIWRDQIGVDPARIVRRGMADNFWSMGVPGPCGPCSELYLDRGPQYGPDGGPEVDEDRYMEFWNLVFMQFERGPGQGKEEYPILGELPSQNIDTGMGLERMATLLQGVDNMYEIDEVRPVLDRAAELTGRRYGARHEDDVRLRVIADHVRSSLMMIGDGVTPSNEGRGYVLRRMLRRTIRAVRLLGYDKPSLPELLPVSRDLMADSYPELATDYGRISMIAHAEEETFRRTLAAGTTILDTAVAKAREAGAPLAGDKAFQLHDTYGFPIDLTLEMAAEQGVPVDEAAFRDLMAQQRLRAKSDSAAKKSGHRDVSVYRSLLDYGTTVFTGYEELTTEGTVLGIIGEQGPLTVASEGEQVEIVLDRTPFYAESGGQVADEGFIHVGEARLRVLDVQRPVKGLIAHRVVVDEGEFVVGQGALAQVDPEWRTSARQAHSGTHIVHAALRSVLGPSALQSGSYNKPGYLRLDFAWGQALSPATRSEIEDVSNQALRRDLPVAVRYMPLAEAREIGALALFGENYDEEVRVVEIGGEWSRELCGGTHVAHSAQVGTVTLIGESSVGAGVRRVEAYVGLEAMRYAAKERALVAELSDLLKVSADDVPARVGALLERLRAAEKELQRARAAQVLASAGELAAGARHIGGASVVAQAAPDGVAGNDLRALATDVRGRLPAGEPGVVVLTSVVDGAVHFVAAVNQAGRDAGLAAGDIVRGFAPAVGARGGGKADLAQGAGGDPALVPAAFAQLERMLAETRDTAR
jgi:alanyl-tRNA synthetase